MGLSADDVVAQAVDGGHVYATVVSNEEDGICLWAHGSLLYSASHVTDTVLDPQSVVAGISLPRLSGELPALFSDRRLDLTPAKRDDGPTPAQKLQPFWVDAAERLGVSITLSPGKAVHVTLTLFGTVQTVSMEKRGKLLVGVGFALGRSEGGLFVVSFQSMWHV